MAKIFATITLTDNNTPLTYSYLLFFYLFFRWRNYTSPYNSIQVLTCCVACLATTIPVETCSSSLFTEVVTYKNGRWSYFPILFVSFRWDRLIMFWGHFLCFQWFSGLPFLGLVVTWCGLWIWNLGDYVRCLWHGTSPHCRFSKNVNCCSRW